MEPARRVGQAFFPLDEQLGLLSTAITPRGEELLVRLAVWMPIAQARDLLSDMMGIEVSKATARRATLQTGEAALALCEQQEQELKREVPEAAVGADKQALSADGAFVPLVGGEWVEVKTLIIGEVTRNRRGRCVRCKMGQCGCKDWSTISVQTPCACWILRMRPNTSMRSGKGCKQQEADCQHVGWLGCCTDSNTRDPGACSTICGGWWRAFPVPACRRN